MPSNRSRLTNPIALPKAVEALLSGANADDDNVLLIRDILFEIANESHVHVTHPKLVRNYVLTVTAAQLKGRELQIVSRGLAHVRELVAGVTPKRLDEIDRLYNPDSERDSVISMATFLEARHG